MWQLEIDKVFNQKITNLQSMHQKVMTKWPLATIAVYSNIIVSS